jgi:hypothetical protein
MPHVDDEEKELGSRGGNAPVITTDRPESLSMKNYDQWWPNIKEIVAYYCRLHAVGGKNALTNIFYQFNVSQCTCKRWITTVSNLHICP